MCLYRDAEVVITSWTDARIPWPQCRVLGARGGSGLRITGELVRAIRTESAEAIKHWFGVGVAAVWHWRRAFDVSRWGTEGSRLLLQQNSEAGAAQVRGQKVPACIVRRRVATQRAAGNYGYCDRWKTTGWTPERLALLGTLPDAEVAAKIGRREGAVRVKWLKLGIPTAVDRRRRVVVHTPRVPRE
jgi:hypothetical protein